MMGAGKSSIGRRLAARLGIPFVDADTEIESAAGMTIPEIFDKHGEPYFRAGEARVIARLLDSGPQVLATGGGAVMDQSTRDLIHIKGISVWLKADLDVLMKRTKRRNDRPLAEQDQGPAAAARAVLCPVRHHRAVARRAARHHRRRDHRRARQASRARAGTEAAMTAPLRHRGEPIVVQVALGARAYDIVIGRGLLARARRAHQGAAARRQDRDRHRRDRGQASSRAPPRPRSKSAGIESAAHRGAAGRGLQELRDVRDRVRGDHRGAHRARRSRGRARRRRDRRSRRLCRGQRAARARLRAGADHAAGAGRFLGRRQDRHQFAPRQESGRRLPSAGPGDRRHRAARHAADARIPRRLCRGGQIRAARRRRVLLLAGSQLAGRFRRRSPAREHAIAVCCRGKAGIVARDERETGERALLNLGHTFGHALEAGAASPTGCCTARRWRSAWRWRSNSPPARADAGGRRRARARSSCGGRPAHPI